VALLSFSKSKLGPLPPRVLHLAQLLPPLAHSSTWLIYHLQSRSVILQPPSYYIHRKLLRNTLLFRNRCRASRSAPPVWLDSTLPLESIVTQLPHVSLGRATHVNCLLLQNHLSVRSDVIKTLISHSPAWVAKGRCPLACSPDARDSYHHWTGDCYHPELVRICSAFLASHLVLDVPPAERALLDAFTGILATADNYFRLCIGDLPRHLPHLLLPLYLALSSNVCARDRIFLQHLRRFYRLVEAVFFLNLKLSLAKHDGI